jgi:hypothetical protein
VSRVALTQRRRLLRNLGIRAQDLDAVGRALILNWSRAAGALALLDAYANDAGGWLDENGEPRAFTRVYVSLLNAERLAALRLADHLRARDQGQALAPLAAHGRRARLAAVGDG